MMLAWLIPLFPLIGFLINGLFGGATKKAAGPIATALVFASFAVAVWLLLQVNAADDAHKQTTVYLAQWLNVPGDNLVHPFRVNFELLIDPLSVMMMLIITGVGGLIHLYSIGYMAADKQYTRFFTYLNLFLFFMLLLVMGNNLLILFIGWEGVGLCSYLLIGYFFEKKSAGDAAKKAFIMNRIGDVGVLIGMFMIFQYFGTLDFVGSAHGALAANGRPVAGFLAQAAANPAFAPGNVIAFICLMLFLGATGKSAQIPLYTWLPDAMEGPTPVSALIHAATMVTAGVYMVSRSHILFQLSDIAMATVCIVGILTAIFAASIGLAQNDIKRVLAYSTVSQLGYMFAACGAGGFAAGMYHVMTHAFFKACLFLCSGSVIHAIEHGMHAKDGHDTAHDDHATDVVAAHDTAGGPDPHDPQDMRNMGGLRPRIPLTYGTMLVATLAIAGIMPFAGFYSKDEILWRLFNFPLATQTNIRDVIWGIGAVTAMVTAFYMFRLIMKTFEGQPRTDAAKAAHESPLVMTLPLIILAALSAVTGWLFMPFPKFEEWLSPAVGTSTPLVSSRLLEHPLGYATMGVCIVAILGCIAAYRNAKNGLLLSPAQRGAFAYQAVLHKYWVDEAYNFWFVKLGKKFAYWLWQTFDIGVVDRAVNGVAGFTDWAGSVLRRAQTGYVRTYAFTMVFGIILVLALCLAGLGH